MPNFDKLPNAKSGFPHIGNIDTYKYDDAFDYSRFDAVQMELQLCTVPWDMGEAHIGNRTISGIGNVVYFGSKRQRDAWFDAIPDAECYRFSTKFKELHREGVIDVPVPYDMCAKHNYLVVRYAKFANEDSPVQYEGNDGLREWFWFVREVEFVAPNTTRLHLMDDAFQTWIYDVTVTGMVLERGHAPMFETRADEYLSNPVEKCRYLLTEDVNYGSASVVKHIDALGLNAGDMYVCFAVTSLPTGTWGAKADDSWVTPAPSSAETNGVPGIVVFAVAASDLDSFLGHVDSDYPQFKQTVQGVFFASSDLLTLGTAFTFASTACYPVSASRKTFSGFVELDKSLFGYPAEYAGLAKLYTYPYARIDVTDENGEVTEIRIEDTAGRLDVSAALSLAFPYVAIDAQLIGVGGNAGATVTFKNLDSRTFSVSGSWYETIMSWSVPVFAIVQQASTQYDYSTHFDRAQRVVDYTSQQDNENASAVTTQANEDAIADTQVANAAIATNANTASTNRSNTSMNTDASNTVTLNTAMNTATNLIVGMTASSTIAANEQQGAISTASGVASAAVGAVSSAVSLDLGGVVSSVAGGIIGGVTTQAQTAVANGLTAAQATYTQAGNNASTTGANTDTNNKAANHTATQSDLTDIQNDATTGTTANTAATEKANAARNYATSTANAARTAAAAQSGIDNDIAQAALGTPLQYGSPANAETATTKPIAMFAHIVTQSKSAIASAGDEFLRYGYMLDRQWEFDGNWNIGKYFTYWKLKDFWVRNLDVPDMYMDRLRFFLFGGVTVWRNPDDIGKVTVYDNFS